MFSEGGMTTAPDIIFSYIGEHPDPDVPQPSTEDLESGKAVVKMLPGVHAMLAASEESKLKEQFSANLYVGKTPLRVLAGE